MMSKSGNNNINAGGSIGFNSILTLIFITLKLTGYIDWSWWWVLGPTWIPLVILLVVVFLVAFFKK